MPSYSFCLHTLMFLLFFSQNLPAQINLVANPSFEIYNMCPSSFSTVAAAGMQHDYVHEWVRPTNGTSDYFNACSAHASVPYNFCGYQQAADGKAYCGLFVFATDDTTTNDYVYREYLLGRLISSLVKDKVYCIGFYASPGESLTASYKDYMYAAKEMGLYVSVDPPIVYDSLTNSHAPELPYTPQIVNQHGVMSDTARWYRISGTYTAQGGERWITIGNFPPRLVFPFQVPVRRARVFSPRAHASSAWRETRFLIIPQAAKP
jgi:OOP family OmpA-OmpF porin